MFLSECKLKPGDAIQLAKSFLEAGHNSREQLLSLSEQEISRLVKATGHRKKIIAHIRNPATLASPRPAKKTKVEITTICTEAPPPPSRCAAEKCTAVLKINRTPVMILWAAVVASQKLDYDWNESLSLASAVSALNARAKGISIGTRNEDSFLYDMASDTEARRGIPLLGREVPARNMYPTELKDGTRGDVCMVRGVSEAGATIAPSQVHNYLQNAYKTDWVEAYSAFCILAESRSKEER